MAQILEDNGNQTIRVVQITDSHLFADSDTIFDGINTFETLKDVVALVASQQDRIDCILCTGDLAQDASVQAYHNFQEALAGFDAPQLWIPGNHDTRTGMREAVGRNSERLNRSIQMGKWRIVMLDSHVEGKVYGTLAESELEALDMELEEGRRNDSFVLVCVHHNCLPVEAAWLQQHCLKNSDDFFAVLDKYSNVKGILYGHIHQEFESSRNGVAVFASPSTCIQFHPSNDDFTIDNANPGYRWLELEPDGGIKSGVNRVEEKTYNIDFSSTGY